MASAALMPAFLGKPAKICIVTNDSQRTLTGLCKLGIGPWRIYTFAPDDTADQIYRGKPHPFTIRFCHAEVIPGGLAYQVVQPIRGRTIYQDFLDKQGEGLHHVAYDCNNIPMEKITQICKDRGLEVTQGGCWKGGYTFKIFEEDISGSKFETNECANGWQYPEPEEWFPGKPTAENGKMETREGKGVEGGKFKGFLKLGH